MKKKSIIVRSIVAVISTISLVGCGSQKVVTEEMSNYYYEATDEEREMAYLMAYAVAGDEEASVQTMVTNVAINRAKDSDMDLLEVFAQKGAFYAMHNGVPSYCIVNEDQSTTWVPVTDEMITDELKEAVDLAFTYDYTEGAKWYWSMEDAEEFKRQPNDYFQNGKIFFIRQF